MYDSDSLEEFFKIFCKLKNYSVLSEQELAKQKEYQQAFNMLSSGSFYHQWQQKHKIDLRFRLKLSEEEKKRRKNKTDEPERYLGLESSRVGDLKNNNHGKKFCAIVKISNNQILTGIFVKLYFEDDWITDNIDGFYYKRVENAKEELCLIKDLITFKIIEN